MIRILLALALVVSGTVVLTAGGAPIAAEVADADAGVDTAPELIALAPVAPATAPALATLHSIPATARVPSNPLHARVFRPPRA